MSDPETVHNNYCDLPSELGKLGPIEGFIILLRIEQAVWSDPELRQDARLILHDAMQAVARVWAGHSRD